MSHNEVVPSRTRFYTHPPTAPQFLVAEYDGRGAAIPGNTSYEETIRAIQRTFSRLRMVDESRIHISALLNHHVRDLVRITQHSWSSVLPFLASTQVRVGVSEWVEIFVVKNYSPGRGQLNLEVDLAIDTTDMLKELVYSQEGIIPDQQRMSYGRELLEEGRMLSEYNIGAGCRINLMLRLRGGKPVIYLFPPEPSKHITVELSLARTWSFSEIYPHTPIVALDDCPENLAQTITWIVDAEPDGTLLDQASGREVAYLFWEAYTNPKPPSSPPTTRPATPTEAPTIAFDPSNPVLSPSQSALLPFDKVTGYIDDVLIALGLHTEARTSFITYWLLNLSEHAFIALRFLPQDEYEKAAPLNITPAPQVITRVFMLFMGVEASQLGHWGDAVAMADKDVTMWRDIVGIDIARVQDTSPFRVLEWGGMEVK